nr:rhodanese-like domain-containing protein [Pleomorphomonas koreensis]
MLRDAPDTIELIDVRTPEEYAITSMPGARNIELNQLRKRLGEIGRGKPVIIFCQVGLCGYLACRILKQSGFDNVRNLTGGFKTYAWAVEKQANPDLFDYETIRLLDAEEIDSRRNG